MTRSCRLLALLLMTLMPLAGLAAEPLKIVASIKPLALIAREVAGPTALVSTILPAGVSPHEFTLKVSDRQALAQADLVLWVGPELETFLQKPIERRPAGRVVTAAKLAGIEWPDGDGQTHAGHNHSHGRDPHLWLNPDNVAVLANVLAQRLAHLRPDQAEALNERAAQLADQLAERDRQWQTQLADAAGRGFAVYHDGYRHLVAHYGLNQVDYVSLTPERRPGARHLYELEKNLADSAVCLFVEPYADTEGARALARRVGLRVGILDPLAANESVTTYTGLMRSMVQSLSTCLLGQLQGDTAAL